MSDCDYSAPGRLHARWGEPWLFGVPAGGAGPDGRRERPDVISDTHTVPHICIAGVRPRP